MGSLNESYRDYLEREAEQSRLEKAEEQADRVREGRWLFSHVVSGHSRDLDCHAWRWIRADLGQFLSECVDFESPVVVQVKRSVNNEGVVPPGRRLVLECRLRPVETMHVRALPPPAPTWETIPQKPTPWQKIKQWWANFTKEVEYVD